MPTLWTFHGSEVITKQLRISLIYFLIPIMVTNYFSYKIEFLQARLFYKAITFEGSILSLPDLKHNSPYELSFFYIYFKKYCWLLR